jgi:hypothetical protein
MPPIKIAGYCYEVHLRGLLKVYVVSIYKHLFNSDPFKRQGRCIYDHDATTPLSWGLQGGLLSIEIRAG